MHIDWVITALFELDDDPVLKNVNDILPEILQSYRLPAAIRWSLLFTTLVPVPGISIPSGCEPMEPLSFLSRSTGFTLMEKPCCGDSPEFSGYQILAVDLQNNDLCFCLFLPKMRIPLKPEPWNEATIVVPPMEISVQCSPPGIPYSLSYRNKSYGSWLRFSPMHVNRL